MFTSQPTATRCLFDNRSETQWALGISCAGLALSGSAVGVALSGLRANRAMQKSAFRGARMELPASLKSGWPLWHASHNWVQMNPEASRLFVRATSGVQRHGVLLLASSVAAVVSGGAALLFAKNLFYDNCGI